MVSVPKFPQQPHTQLEGTFTCLQRKNIFQWHISWCTTKFGHSFQLINVQFESFLNWVAILLKVGSSSMELLAFISQEKYALVFWILCEISRFRKPWSLSKFLPNFNERKCSHIQQTFSRKNTPESCTRFQATSDHNNSMTVKCCFDVSLWRVGTSANIYCHWVLLWFVVHCLPFRASNAKGGNEHTNSSK